MGKGDRKTKRGKIFKSSFGKSRPQRTKSKSAGAEIIVKPSSKSSKEEEE